MKTLHRHLLTAGLLASLGLAAVAQTPNPPTPPAGPATQPTMQGERGRMDPARQERFRARMEERMARRLGELKQKLQITGAQEGAWTTWTTAVKPVRLQRPDRASLRAMTTPERLDRLRTVRAERMARMDKRIEATKAFYTALNADQQKVFDAEGLRFVRGGKEGRRGGRHPMRHHG